MYDLLRLQCMPMFIHDHSVPTIRLNASLALDLISFRLCFLSDFASSLFRRTKYIATYSSVLNERTELTNECVFVLFPSCFYQVATREDFGVNWISEMMRIYMIEST